MRAPSHFGGLITESLAPRAIGVRFCNGIVPRTSTVLIGPDAHDKPTLIVNPIRLIRWMPG